MDHKALPHRRNGKLRCKGAENGPIAKQAVLG